jgi:hypothetical protein
VTTISPLATALASASRDTVAGEKAAGRTGTNRC